MSEAEESHETPGTAGSGVLRYRLQPRPEHQSTSAHVRIQILATASWEFAVAYLAAVSWCERIF